MARPRRLELPGVVYHVIVRGNERRPVFIDHEDRKEYLGRVALYREKFGFRLFAYCLMTNHVHLAIRSGETPLSRIMACLQSSYTQWFNRRHDRVGHLFQGRYKAFLVQEDRYLLALVRYIHLNPVRARIVERPGDYRWSSDRYFRVGRPPSWLDVDDVLRWFGLARGSALKRYLALVDGPDSAPLDYEKLRAVDQTIKGDEAFALTRLKRPDELDPPLRGLSEDRVIASVSRTTGISIEKLLGPARMGAIAEARGLAAYVAATLGGISRRRMARRFHLEDSSLTRPVSRLEARVRTDAGLRDRIRDIVAELRNERQDDGPSEKSSNHD